MKRLIQILSIVLVLILIGFGWLFYKEWNQQTIGVKEWKEVEKVSTKKEEDYFLVDWDQVRAINKDVVGWIYMPNCGISYPILQDSNNAYYINHTMYHTYDEAGSIFLNADNQSNFRDTNSIIYGHSVQYLGGMFTNIHKFKDKAYFEQNDHFYLLTPDINYRCNIVAFAKTEDQSIFYESHSLNQEEKVEYAAQLTKKALYGSVASNDIENGLITLSTCDLEYGLYSHQRLVVVGVKEEYQGKIPL